MFTIIAAIVINWETIILAIITATPPTLVAAAALYQAIKAKNKTIETHEAVNSRMTELLEISKKASADAATLTEKRTQEVKDDLKTISEKTTVIAENGVAQSQKAKVPDTIVVDEIHAEKILVDKKPTKGTV